jgi:pimeloyl-ACP methyl ester carboxylesterase
MSDGDLRYSEQGAGLPLVLLHGFPFDAAMWDAQVADLREVARVLAPDLPGFGASPPLPGAPEDARLDDYARAVLRWLDGLSVATFTLAGHSMGGYVALALARLAPLRLAGLILVASRAGADTAEAAIGRHALALAVRERGPTAVVEANLPRLLAPGDGRSEARQRTREMMLRQSPAGIVAALYAMASRPDSTAFLRTVETPALILAGMEDQLIPRADAEALRDGLRNAALVEIPEAGHMAPLEAPDAVNAALRPFVAGLEPPFVAPLGS